MEEIYFSKYKEFSEKIKKEQKEEKISVSGWGLLTWYTISGLLLIVSVFLFFENGLLFKILFVLSFISVIASAFALSKYGDNQIRNTSFLKHQNYQDYCKKIATEFEEYFKIRHVKHYEIILNQINEKKSSLYKESITPQSKVESFTRNVFLYIFVSSGAAMIGLSSKFTDENGQLYNEILNHFFTISVFIAIIILIIWGAALWYKNSFNKELKLLQEFSDCLQEIIIIKNGYYDD